MNPKLVSVRVSPQSSIQKDLPASPSHILVAEPCSKWEVTLDTNKHFKIWKDLPEDHPIISMFLISKPF